MRNILVLIILIYTTTSAYCQSDYVKLTKYPTTSKFKIVEVIGMREDTDGEMHTVNKKSANWYMIISAYKMELIDYNQRGKEELEILEVGTFNDRPGYYYFKVQSKFDGIYGEIVLNDKGIAYSKAYQETELMMLKYEKIY